jgi:hypothetical protein
VQEPKLGWSWVETALLVATLALGLLAMGMLIATLVA